MNALQNIQTVQADLNRQEGIIKAFEGIEQNKEEKWIVINCAAETKYGLSPEVQQMCITLQDLI